MNRRSGKGEMQLDLQRTPGGLDAQNDDQDDGQGDDAHDDRTMRAAWS